VLDHFRGSFLQTPPPYSAKKVAGVAAYERARKNEPVELRPTSVTVRELRLLPESDLGPRSSDLATGDTSLVRLRVAASSGFYVRSLAHDIGQRLGCGAHLEALRRTRVGGFRVEEACTLDVLEAAGPAAPCVRTMNGLLGAWPEVRLTEEGLRRAGHGNSLGPQHLAGRPPERPGRVRVLDGAGELLAVAEERPDGLLHPLLVLR
jgi:tRNA pseudouridine55 synthase